MTRQNLPLDGLVAQKSQIWEILDVIPARISFLDTERRHAYLNSEYEAFIGRPAREILGKTVAEIYGAAEDLRLRPFAEAALRGETVTWEGWVKSPDQEDHYIERVYKPFLEEDGRVAGYFVLVRDTTEHREAEREQKRLHQILQDAIDSLPNGFVVYGPDWRVALCNTAFAEMLRAPPESLIGLTPEDVLHKVVPQIQTYDGKALERVEDWVAEVMTRFDLTNREPIEIGLRDGRYMLLSIHPTSDGGRVGIRTEITVLKRVQEALQKGDAVAQDVLGACPLPIGMTRAADGAIIYESPASERLFMRDASTPLKESAAGYFVNPDDRKRYVELLRKNNAVDGFEVEMRKSDGTRFWVSLSARRINYRGEEVIVSSTLDLTDRHEIEAQLARQREALYQSEKLNALGGLLAGVAHELNNPLSVVVGQSHLLQEIANDPEIRTRAERIGNAADRCARIVKTFIAMARQSTPERCEVDVNDVVASALEITGYALHSADIEVTRNLASDLPKVWADSDQLNQVIMNLIVNAEQAMADQATGRSLKISTRFDQAAQLVQVSVEDSGPGIPPEVRARIFDPFYTTKDVGVGTGVGLTVSHSIVDSHEGTLEVDSRPGRGATFIVSLPPSRGRAVETADTAAGDLASSGGTILIVDDEQEVSETLADLMLLKGHRVEIANSGKMAIEALAQRNFDVILCDMRMPDIDGRGFYARVKEDYPQLIERIVFITGDALGAANRSFLDDTGLPYLEKPLAAEEVVEVVGRIIGNSPAIAVLETD